MALASAEELGTMMQNPAQQVLQETDTSSQAADSVQGSLTEITGRVTDTGRLILEGRWDAVWNRVVEGGTDQVAAFVPNVLVALFVAFVFFVAYWILAGIAKEALSRSSRVDEGLETMAMKTLRVVGLGFIGVLVLAQLGVNVSALVAGLGIACLAVGFAAKDSLENFISGATILMDRPFFVGNWITVGAGAGQLPRALLGNETLAPEEGETAHVLPLERLLLAGASHPAFLVDGPRDPLETLLTVGAAGCALKENCRISRVVISTSG